MPPYPISLFLILILSTTTTGGHPCSPPSPAPATNLSCPPFHSHPPFPFSTFPGCGHPSFQLHCSSSSPLNNSVLTINHLPFSLLHYNPPSLLLSPILPTTTPISLSNSPFQFSDASCSRLSALKPCPPPIQIHLPNCSHSPWHCNLIHNPLHLLRGCGSQQPPHHPPISDQGCQTDVLQFLHNFLKWGVEVDWVQDQDTYFSSCNHCHSINGVCGFNQSDPNKHFICFPPNNHNHNHNHSHSQVTTLSIAFLFLCILIFSFAAIVFRSKRKSDSTPEDPTILFLRRHRSASLLPPAFSYDELEISTNRFDPKRKIGDGGFGSVFLGQLFDGRIVAVKHLHKHAFSTKSFCNEILILSSIHHPNLVKLHGYCSDPKGLLLVYDYVPNGTLADHLHGPTRTRKPPLNWKVRLDMAVQIAMAIEYLHFSVLPPIVHRDVTSSNIFIERDMRIKVGDFGLSRLLVLPETEVWTGPQGTPGYLDPDYYRSFRLTEKSDVYSFGVVLLELITGMKAVDQRREKREMALADLVVAKIHLGVLTQVLDPALVVDGEAVDGVGVAAELAFRCVAADKDDRPDAKEVVAELTRIRNRTRTVTVTSSTSVVVPDDES